MIDMTTIFHTGIVVENLEKAMEEIGQALNLDWSSVREFDPIVHWIPDVGRKEIAMKAVYSKQGPVHLELCEGPADSFYDIRKAAEGRHVGIWVDDLVAETERLQSLGWKILAANGTPEEGYGVLTYMTPADGSMVVELVAAELKPMIAEWIAG